MRDGWLLETGHLPSLGHLSTPSHCLVLSSSQKGQACYLTIKQGEGPEALIKNDAGGGEHRGEGREEAELVFLLAVRSGREGLDSRVRARPSWRVCPK